MDGMAKWIVVKDHMWNCAVIILPAHFYSMVPKQRGNITSFHLTLLIWRPKWNRSYALHQH